jgi:hypothetical protein
MSASRGAARAPPELDAEVAAAGAEEDGREEEAMLERTKKWMPRGRLSLSFLS